MFLLYHYAIAIYLFIAALLKQQDVANVSIEDLESMPTYSVCTAFNFPLPLHVFLITILFCLVFACILLVLFL